MAKIADSLNSQNSPKIKKGSKGNKPYSDDKEDGLVPVEQISEKVNVATGRLGYLGDQIIKFKELSSNSAENPLSHKVSHRSPNSPNFPKSPNSPTLPLLLLPNLTNKDKIIISVMNKEKTIKQISDELNIDLKKVSHNIKRSDRDGGLLKEELIEKRINNNKNHFVASQKGKNYILYLLEEKENEEEQKTIDAKNTELAITQINLFKSFIEDNYIAELFENGRNGNKYLAIDFIRLAGWNPELADQLLENPEEVIKAAEIAIEQIDVPTGSKGFYVRFNNLTKASTVSIRNIRSVHLMKFQRFEGTVRQKSDVRPQVTSAKYECPSCGTIATILQQDVKMKEPTKCGCGRKGKFKFISKELIDAQSLVLEENLEELDGSEQPKKMKVFLTQDLVSALNEKKTAPGSKVIVNGYVKDVPIILRTGGQSTRYDLMINANYIEPVDEEFEQLIISPEEEKEIKKLSKSKDVIEQIVKSIAPSIYGHDKIKEALLIQMLGGVKRKKRGGGWTRSDMHVLLIGDPGSGKTQLLKRVDMIAPKSRFISGKGASGVGLTATVVRDDFIGGWALEAGALVLANKGILCLDELDKMGKEDTSAMHEALEGQTITIAKANIQATLKCETTVLAAANPKFGRFDPFSKTIAEQIELPITLINRFDLIFPVKDLPDEEKDRALANFLTDIHMNNDTENYDEVLETEFLRKYIAYAKQIKPVLTEAARNELVEYYLKMRGNGDSSNKNKQRPVHISPRQLEGGIRIADACAKARLSKRVQVKDAKRAVQMIDYCLKQIAFDEETGTIDIDRIASKETYNNRSKINTVKNLILELSKNNRKKEADIEDIVVQAANFEITRNEVGQAIEKLKRSGDIFEPRRGSVKLI